MQDPAAGPLLLLLFWPSFGLLGGPIKVEEEEHFILLGLPEGEEEDLSSSRRRFRSFRSRSFSSISEELLALERPSLCLPEEELLLLPLLLPVPTAVMVKELGRPPLPAGSFANGMISIPGRRSRFMLG